MPNFFSLSLSFSQINYAFYHSVIQIFGYSDVSLQLQKQFLEEMMNIEEKISNAVKAAIQTLYGVVAEDKDIQLQKTKKGFAGDFTIVVFPFLKASKKSPEQTASEIGEYLQSNAKHISSHNVVKGFLNISISPEYWLGTLNEINHTADFGLVAADADSPLVMIEYSSPNTNKPLHLGHIRNNLLGYSLSKIMQANGNRVVKTNIVNDRGIHICKSMLAWQIWGNGETPKSTGKKGDHLVGDYYVKFDKEYKAEIKHLVEAGGMTEEEAKAKAPLMVSAQEMLRRWEDGDPQTRAVWSMMNGWVYEGFDKTYKKLGVSFDKIYYESETYLEGKEKVEEGLAKGAFYKREDGSVWADLTGEGLDEKLLLRADGTSVYMTQDIGTAKLRYDDYPDINKMIYVVGNEQNYHFQVLAILLSKLGFEWGKELVHFSYGMVELPEGKMKSREGTVVDADDLVAEMEKTALETANELGKLDNCTSEEIKDISQKVALSALKYFILKVDPRKNMTFNPKESIDFNGNTGPFIQYTYARIQSVLRKAAAETHVSDLAVHIPVSLPISEKELSLIKLVNEFPATVKQAGAEYSPSVIANYAYELVKEYNQFYHDFSILKEEDETLRLFRLVLSKNIASVIYNAFALLGIEMTDRM